MVSVHWEGPKIDHHKRDTLLILARHGESTVNTQNLISSSVQGHPLTEVGRDQSASLAQELKRLRVERVISSELVRARQTAEILATSLGRKVIVDSRLNERVWGELEGTHALEYEQGLDGEFGVEPYDQMAQRLRDFIAEDHRGVVVAVSHKYIMRTPVLEILGLDEHSGALVGGPYGSMIILHISEDGIRVIAVGVEKLTEDVLRDIPKRFVKSL